MLKKNIVPGKQLSTHDLKRVKGGIADPCKVIGRRYSLLICYCDFDCNGVITCDHPCNTSFCADMIPQQ